MGANPYKEVPLRVRRLHEKGHMPEYGSEEAAGADLYAAFDGEAIEIPARGRAIVPLGIAIELPVGYEAQIRPRSGLSAKHGLTVLNAPGTIDSDYRGELKVIMHNTSDRPFYVNCGDRVAQMVVAPVTRVNGYFVETLDGTNRGENGFGSTGV